MLQLLDVVIEPARTIPDTSRVIPQPTLPDSLPSDSVHTIASSDVFGHGLQLADVFPISGLGGLFEANLLWTILVVLFALCLCFYFVRKYRNQHNQ